jgi:hypothetical protein
MTPNAIIITSNVNQDGANTTTRELAAATFDDEKTFDEGNAQKNWRMVKTRIAISTTTAKITSAGGMRGLTIKGVVIKNRIITAGTSIKIILAIMKTSNVNQNGAMVRDAQIKRIQATPALLTYNAKITNAGTQMDIKTLENVVMINRIIIAGTSLTATPANTVTNANRAHTKVAAHGVVVARAKKNLILAKLAVNGLTSSAPATSAGRVKRTTTYVARTSLIPKTTARNWVSALLSTLLAVTTTSARPNLVKR